MLLVIFNAFMIFLQALGKFAFVQLYVPPIAAIDTNLVVIWLLAVGTIVIGAYWSGVIATEQRCVCIVVHVKLCF
jgi:hypothetical protein